MTPPAITKASILKAFHDKLQKPVEQIKARAQSREAKANAVNQLVTQAKQEILASLQINASDKQLAGIVVQYCYSVASLEYRHSVWPYEYMAFSRRVGELWEKFCSAAWDHPSRAAVTRIGAPKFHDVRAALQERIQDNIGWHKSRDVILSDIAILFDIIGNINMKEDEVFTVDGVPHVIDFKSGFGSNEKGNMLRLKTVGQAYKIWNHQTTLLLLVRQDINNNYLNVLRRAGLWSVHTGADAYSKMSELTGGDMNCACLAWWLSGAGARSR